MTMTTLAERPPAHLGRPTRDQAQALSARILDAAALLFAQNGYQATSIDAVAYAAGVTKRTLYSRFESKPLLLAQVLRMLVTRITPPPASGLGQLPLEARLHALGKHLLEHAITEGAGTWSRVISSELIHVPELRQYVSDSTDILHAHVRGVFAAAIAAGEWQLHDLDFAARAYVRLILAPVQDLVLLGEPLAPDVDRDRYVKHAVALFLRGCTA